MKLRNKKTEEVVEREEFILIKHIEGDGGWQDESYHSLAELNEEWEDYKPAEPLIKDEKIRKAVRAWAEANLMKKVKFEYIENEGSYFSDCSCSIRFYEDLHLTNRHEYTITELCGDE